jgi:signal transduction histidine kinase
VGETLRILLVDDSEQDRFLVLRELAREFPGVLVEAATDADRLAQALEAGNFDLVITDYELRWGDGLQVLRTVKARHPECPVIMFTGSGSEEVAVAAMKGGLDDYLLKSAQHAHRLTAAARAALGRAEARRRAARAEAERADLLRREQAARAEAERLYRAAQEEARRKDEFLAMLGHELRNPLAPIRNALHVLQVRPTDDPLVQQLHAMMARQVGHMARLVDDLLDASRLARGKIELRREPTDLALTFQRVVEAVRPLIEERRHHLEVRPPAEPVSLHADPVRLEQVLFNLLTNAAKYTEPGGRIELSGQREGGTVVLRVRDTGMGIRPEMLPRIFDLFAQDHGPERTGEGLGIGLTLVKSLVELHGGSVEAHSGGPGQGSEFVVRLPAQPPAGPGLQSREGQEAEGAGGRGFRVLICDDNVDGAVSLGLLLQLRGHKVRVVHDGRAALEAAREQQPEIILLDLGLPRGPSGFEVGRRLRQDLGLTRTLLAAVTGYGQDEDRRRTTAAGFDRHLLKPVGPEAIDALLEEARRRFSPGPA